MKKQKTKVKTSVIITGMICITAIELYALSRGVNGRLLATVLTILGALTGLVIPTPRQLQ